MTLWRGCIITVVHHHGWIVLLRRVVVFEEYVKSTLVACVYSDRERLVPSWTGTGAVGLRRRFSVGSGAAASFPRKQAGLHLRTNSCRAFGSLDRLAQVAWGSSPYMRMSSVNMRRQWRKSAAAPEHHCTLYLNFLKIALFCIQKIWKILHQHKYISRRYARNFVKKFIIFWARKKVKILTDFAHFTHFLLTRILLFLYNSEYDIFCTINWHARNKHE